MPWTSAAHSRDVPQACRGRSVDVLVPRTPAGCIAQFRDGHRLALYITFTMLFRAGQLQYPLLADCRLSNSHGSDRNNCCRASKYMLQICHVLNAIGALRCHQCHVVCKAANATRIESKHQIQHARISHGMSHCSALQCNMKLMALPVASAHPGIVSMPRREVP